MRREGARWSPHRGTTGDEPGGEYQGDEPGREPPRELHVRGGRPGRRPHRRPPGGEPRVRGAACSPTMAPQAPVGRVPLREGSPCRGRDCGPVTGSPRQRCGIRSEPRWWSELSASHQSSPFYSTVLSTLGQTRTGDLNHRFATGTAGRGWLRPALGQTVRIQWKSRSWCSCGGTTGREPRDDTTPRGSPTTAEQKRLCRPTASRPSVPMSLVDHRRSLPPSVYTGPCSGQ